MARTHVAAAALIVAALAGPPLSASQTAHDIPVTVTYKGPRIVDASHPIPVILSESPRPSERPSSMVFQKITVDGGTTTFKSVKASPVHIFVVYDPAGKWTGPESPEGLPFFMHTTDGRQPAPVHAGSRGKGRHHVRRQDQGLCRRASIKTARS